MDFDHIMIFTDGACSGNPGPGGWGAIVVTPKGKIVELGGLTKETTNNRMELMAAIESLAMVAEEKSPVGVYTDSVYVIKGITQWIWGWRKRQWKNAQGDDVANRDLWERLAKVVDTRQNGQIKWHYVRGHTGTPGNERADEIAVSFAKNDRPKLYRGSLTKYSVAVHDLPESTSLPDKDSSSRKSNKAKAYSYLSYVDGIPKRHKTWAECERLVKGRSGAKFKKSLSAKDEQDILLAWGADPKKLG